MTGARVLVVDDQPANVRLLERILKSNGFSEVVTTTESPEVPEIYRTHKPDLILLDLHMPVMDGFKVLEQLQAMTADEVYLAAEFRDDDTGEHVHRVAHSSALLAGGLGLRPDEVELIRRSSTLHDIGKIGIPDAILLKPGKLTADEFTTIKAHTVIGSQILGGSDVPLLRRAEEIARTHHERWDGSGYPKGLSGESIPIAGRIVSVADVFDALTHDRPYKRAWRVTDAVAEIESQAGRQFDPAVVAAFLDVTPRARAS